MPYSSSHSPRLSPLSAFSIPAIIAVLALAGSSLGAAPAIPNASFEENAPFSQAPGYISGNQSIGGWTASHPARAGLNPAGWENPFANNAATPHGTTVAFLQSDSGERTSLSTVITGLTAGTSYQVQFRVNRRVGYDAPAPSYRFDGGPAVRFSVDTAADAEWSYSQPYFTINAVFTASDATSHFEISNCTPGDSTLLLDSFSISEATPIMVTVLANDGVGSLRQALADAASTPEANVIIFSPALSGGTIMLPTQLNVADGHGVIIDASSLPDSITLEGAPSIQVRLLAVAPEGLLSLRNVTLAKGNVGMHGGGAIRNLGTTTLSQCVLRENHASLQGGAIRNEGVLTLSQCTLEGNDSDNGGALHNEGTMALDQCTLSANVASTSGGAVFSNCAAPGKSTTLTRCTLSANEADDRGGAVYNQQGRTGITHCTISGNEAAVFNGGGGVGSRGDVSTETLVTFSIIAGNHHGDVCLTPVSAVNSFTSGGRNVIGGGNATSDFNVNDITGTDPRLDPLADNGGPTFTMALQGNSPARDAAISSPAVADQRGEAVSGVPDSGAFEWRAGPVFLSQTSYSALEAGGLAQILLQRGGPDGAVSVVLTATAGTATGADFTVGQRIVSFQKGETSKFVNIPVTPDTLVESNEFFNVTLSSPSTGMQLGSPASAKVVLVDASALTTTTDTLPPSLVQIASPVANANLSLPAGTPIIVNGTAADNKAVQSVEVRLTSGGSPQTFTSARLDILEAAGTPWTAEIIPHSGVNTLEVRSTDMAGRVSPVVTRSFKVLRPLSILATGGGTGSFTAGFSPSSFREVGLQYVVTATPASNSLFAGWNIVSGHSTTQLNIIPSALQKPSLTLTFREGLVLEAVFVPNPYPAVAGDFNGLVSAHPTLPDRSGSQTDGTLRSFNTEGLMVLTTMSTGAFSGKLSIDGFVLNVAGIFDHTGVARFGTGRSTTTAVARQGKPSLVLALSMDLSPSRVKDVVTGTVTATDFQRSQTIAVSTVTAERAIYNGSSSVVPSSYLGTAQATQTYTVVFPAKVPFPGVPIFAQGSYDSVFPRGSTVLQIGDHIVFGSDTDGGLTPGVVYVVGNQGSPPGFSLHDLNGNRIMFSMNREVLVSLNEDDPQLSDVSALDYPQGDGFATATVSKAGLVIISGGKLADGSAITATAKLVHGNKFPFFAPLYNNKGWLIGEVELDAHHPESDMRATGESLSWLRPGDITKQHYPSGWESIIKLGFVGARYAASFTSPVSSVLRRADGSDADMAGDAMGTENASHGNAMLSFHDGQLTATVEKALNVSVANVISKVPVNDATYSLGINALAGSFSGRFVHELDDGAAGVAPLMTDFQGILYQKGIHAGGYGFFLTRQPAPIDYTGESGAVILMGR